MPKPLKIAIKTVCILLAAIIIIVGGYLVYAFVAFHRIGDKKLDVFNNEEQKIESGQHKLISYNIGFGAYEQDFGFFMDGGSESWAWSKERLEKNVDVISDSIKAQNAEIVLVQEVDIDSTRTYHYNERDAITQKLDGYGYTFAQNYDSVFLFYPLLQPHGFGRAGLLTLSRYDMQEAERIELPIETGFSQFFDLDRCYSKQYIKTDSDKDLVLYNFHLSAYTSDGTITTEQLEILISDLQSEYEKGNYCIAGGDFNKDILGNSKEIFNQVTDATWAQPIPPSVFENTDISIVAPFDEDNPVPSCRNADGPYNPGQFVVTIDGFLVSPNVKVNSSAVIDTQFAFSDHNPVELTFTLE